MVMRKKIGNQSPKRYAGYIVLKGIANSLTFFEKAVRALSNERQFQYDVYNLMMALVYARATFPASKKKTHEDIIPLGTDIWLCDARVSLDDLNEKLSSQFPTEEFDTLGGFVFDLFGKIPVKFEKTVWNNFDFIIQDMEGHRINVVKLIRRPGDEDPDGKKE